MANTPNLDLVKPAGTDKALVSVINSNSDKIDTGFGSLSDQLTNVSTSSITMASQSYDPGINIIKKVCGVVNITLLLNLSGTFDANTWYSIGTIPSGYTPRMEQRFPILDKNTGLCADGRINASNGLIDFQFGSSKTNPLLRFVITYC